MMHIRFAEKEDKRKAISFFGDHISKDNDWVISYEFLCPYGISAAIDRRQMIIVISDDEVIGGVRFYPRKRDNIVSLYQFAIDKRFRSRGLFREMLRFSGYRSFEGVCPRLSAFNEYYRKQGWENTKTDDRYNYWNYNMI